MLRDFLISLSLANLWFVDIWKLFLIRHSTSYPYYHWKLNPAPLLLATMLDVLLFSAILLVAISLARRLRKESILNIGRAAFAIVFILLLTNLLLIALRTPSLGPLLIALKLRPQLLLEWKGIASIYSWFAALGLIAACVGISLMIHSLIFRRQRFIKLASAIMLILSPFVLVTFGQAAMQCVGYRSGEQFRERRSPAFARETPPRPRILWLIFDEMDFRLSFVERPLDLELPEFDRLRNESIFALNAFPPGGDTVLSLPALINGRLVSSSTRTAPNELMLTFSDSVQSMAWSTQANVFSTARSLGFNTGLAGWYHPYCRLIGNSLTQCSWETAGILWVVNQELADLVAYSEEVSVGRSMLRVAVSVLVPKMTQAWIPRNEASVWRNYAVQEFRNIHQRALLMATDPALNLILVHYPIPHPPGIYDRHKNEFSFNSSSGYLDNLALVDRVLGQLRQSMGEAGAWEHTTLLISSDHSLRADRIWKNHPVWQPAFTKEDPLVFDSTKDDRVPFILRLAGESEGVVYEPAFNAVLSHDLILAVLSGEVSENVDVIKWLDRQRSIAKSPFIEGEK